MITEMIATAALHAGAVYAAMWVHCLLHEAGHALVGRLNGWKILLFAVGTNSLRQFKPWAYDPGSGYPLVAVGVLPLAGHVLCAWPKNTGFRHRAWYYLAGPLGSLACMLAGLAWLGGTGYSTLAFTMAIWGALGLVSSMVPLKHLRHLNDGMRLLQLYRHYRRAELLR